MKFLSLVITAIIIGALLIFQATRSGSAPVLMPSEVLARGSVDIPRLRMAGRIADKPINYQTSPSARLSFSVEDPKHPERGSLPVVYNGVRPDMFAVGRDVIIDGEFSAGEVRAASLLTQCPSKYEAPDPEKKYKEELGG